jgi:hypothetical protein
MTMAITHQSIFLNKHLFVLHLDFPLALQPHFVKPWPSHIEASLTACHEEVISEERRNASESERRQANRMRNLSERILTEVEVGKNIFIPIPMEG